MKFNTNIKEKIFEPIDLVITIETEDELRALYATVNKRTSECRDGNSLYASEEALCNIQMPLFEAVDDICIKKGISR